MLNKTIIYFFLLSLLSSCYCRKMVIEGSSHPRWLRNASGDTTYTLCFGGSKAFVVTPYYGFPSSIENELEKTYSTPTVADFKFETKGQFGIRGEYFISPGFVPYRVLGLGLDYSFAKTSNSYSQTIGSDNFENAFDINSNRLVLSANLYTLITRYGLYGYTTMQGGFNFVEKQYSGNNPNFHFTDRYRSMNFEYRLGYGFQYFFAYPVGISLEGGYGGGAYIRIGISVWI